MAGELLDFVRRHDPDRFFCALFAPAEKRDALMTLYAFNHEIARARPAVSQPMLALIRLEWWREVVEGARRRHEVAGPLGEAIDTGVLSAADLLAMIDAREAEADDAFATEAEWTGWLMGAHGGVAVAAARALDAADPEVFRGGGAAYGAAGVLRSVATLAGRGRCLLPLDVLAAHGLTSEEVIADPATPRLASLLRQLARVARGWMGASGAMPRRSIAAALPAVLARRDLRRSERASVPRGIGDRLDVLAAVCTGRV